MIAFWRTLWDSLHGESEAVKREREKLHSSTVKMRVKIEDFEKETKRTHNLEEVKRPNGKDASHG